jgi:hypothetical protein
MALIRNYLFRHASLFCLCTQEMVVNRLIELLKSGNKSHKISLFYFKFTKVPNFAPRKSLVLGVLLLYFL